MRRLIVSIALLALTAPALAQAAPERQYTNKQLCRRMTKQIDHFENTVLVMAKDRGNDLWANATVQHIDQLKNHRADTCPEWAKQRTAIQKAAEEARQMAEMMKLAAKAAAAYFTGGLGGLGKLF